MAYPVALYWSASWFEQVPALFEPQQLSKADFDLNCRSRQNSSSGFPGSSGQRGMRLRRTHRRSRHIDIAFFGFVERVDGPRRVTSSSSIGWGDHYEAASRYCRNGSMSVRDGEMKPPADSTGSTQLIPKPAKPYACRASISQIAIRSTSSFSGLVDQVNCHGCRLVVPV